MTADQQNVRAGMGHIVDAYKRSGTEKTPSEFIEELVNAGKTDMVNHPPHYTNGPPCEHCGEPIECITITRRLEFNVGNAIKYLWRAGKKNDGDLKKQVEDLRKAAWYCNDEANRIEREEGLA